MMQARGIAILIPLTWVAACGADDTLESRKNMRHRPTSGAVTPPVDEPSASDATAASPADLPDQGSAPGNAAASPPLSPTTLLARVEPLAWTTMINAIRFIGRSCGQEAVPAAPPVAWNDRIAEAAKRHALDMAKSKALLHTGVDGSTMRSRLIDAGYHAGVAGENIATGFTDIARTFALWLVSPAHCTNLMGAGFTEFAMAEAGSYWSIILTTPKSVQPPVAGAK